jgi:DNA mismatch repair protein MutL
MALASEREGGSGLAGPGQVPGQGRGRILRLDSHTVNQIAAGEVVERPASALKELVENALDAGARAVEVRIEGAGRRLIEVSDDGCGMAAEDLPAALERHATSKIVRASDLLSVSTFGFRGEALPSIASVSRLRISSGQEPGSRMMIECVEGRIGAASPEPGPRGTMVRVEELFRGTPARLKFLRSDASELAACLEACGRAALARPDVRFVVRTESGELLRTSGSGDLRTAVGEVWGRDAARALVPVDYLGDGIRVTGLVSPPTFTKARRTHQWLSVNGRPVRARLLQTALDAAVRTLTPERRHVLAAFDCRVGEGRVDVNVSPAKTEVKFRDEQPVFDGVRRAVRAALLGSGMAPTAEGLAEADRALRGGAAGAGDSLREPAALWPAAWPSIGGGEGAAARALEGPFSGLPGMGPFGMGPAAGAGADGPPDAPMHASLPSLLDGLVVLGQADATFIVAENREALLIIDQHVAHERVLYEWLRDGRGSAAIEVQPLLEPEVLELDRLAAERLRPRLGELAAIGFQLEAFGPDSFLVRSIPALSRRRPPLQILRDMAEEIAGGAPSGCLTPARDEVYIMASCRMAVKAGDALARPEMERLIQDLARTENPYFCPHGRPITIRLPKGDIRRRFGR